MTFIINGLIFFYVGASAVNFTIRCVCVWVHAAPPPRSDVPNSPQQRSCRPVTAIASVTAGATAAAAAACYASPNHSLPPFPQLSHPPLAPLSPDHHLPLPKQNNNCSASNELFEEEGSDSLAIILLYKLPLIYLASFALRFVLMYASFKFLQLARLSEPRPIQEVAFLTVSQGGGLGAAA